ncbi:MAG: hypothetical protein AAFX05_09930, partial [Planctomycetota bacterium]
TAEVIAQRLGSAGIKIAQLQELKETLAIVTHPEQPSRVAEAFLPRIANAIAPEGRIILPIDAPDSE